VKPLSVIIALALVATTGAQDEPETPTVGEPAELLGVVLPGSELQVKASDFSVPLVLRILDVWPHGDALRYDFSYYGLEPGTHDLAHYLERVDGSSTEDLPELPVEVRSILPSGQIEPAALGGAKVPDVGGYERSLWIGGILWLVGLVAILAYGRRRQAADHAQREPQSLADRLRPLVSDALQGTLPAERRAELELMLIAYWRDKLGLAETSSAKALAQLKAHAEAGPLLRGLEDWLHRPTPPEDVDVAALLAPYEKERADAIDLHFAGAQ